MTRILPVLFMAVFPMFFIQAQTWAVKRSVMLSASLLEDPPVITLQWANDDANSTGYQVFRRTPGTGSWGAVLATLPPGTTHYDDFGVLAGTVYEYQVVKSASGYAGYGYLTAGIRIVEVEDRGICILVTDNTHSGALSAEIERLVADLEGDGWVVKRLDVSPADPVPAVKDQIKALYNEEPETPHALFLLGHVPVPYSGEINPDGHPDHLGAWPADGYYGDMDGVWTDASVNNTVATGTRNDNVPGDGKFDQSLFPSPIEIEVGRVDFADLPAFSLTETELLRRYLDKDHAFRHGMIETSSRGLIEDNFGSYDEGFSQTGLRAFSSFFGADSVFNLDFQSTLQQKSYLWSYGCGGGSYTSCSGVTNTTNFTSDSLQTVFTCLFGSYFGDWDSNNNLLRAALASGQTLSNAWAGRPNWHFHPMAMGATLGYCTRLTQYNPLNAYTPGYGNRYVHIALMGDPTLRMHVVKPIPNLTVVEDNGHAALFWDASPDAGGGYHVYRRADAEDAFVRINDLPIEGTSYIDSCLVAGITYTYMVRARKLQESASGSYYNLSQGIRADLQVLTDWSVNAGFGATIDGDQLTLSNTSTNADQYWWDFGDGNHSSETEPVHTYQAVGTYVVSLTASNLCSSQTLSHEIEVTVAGTNESHGERSWQIFPNPAKGWITISLEGFSGAIGVRVFDMHGREWENTVVAPGQLLDISALPSGIYFLESTAGDRTWSGSIRKE